MMYFCPCSCNDPVDPETEEHTIVSLPRNLSYVQESYLDRYSVSAKYVYNPKIDRNIRREQEFERAAHDSEEERRLLLRSDSVDSPAKSSLCGAAYGFTASHSVNGACCAHSTATHNSFPPYGQCTQHVDQTDPLIFANKDLPLSPLTTPFSATTPFFPQSTPQPPSSSSLSSPPETTATFSSTCGQQQQQVSSSSSFSSLSPRSVFPAGGILSPAAKVASRLSALLHSPPNESMDLHRNPDLDLGSSVDGDLVSPESKRNLVLNPDHLSLEMDRGSGDVVSGDSSIDVEQDTLRLPLQGLRDIEDDEGTDTSTDSQAPNLFPKPFGNQGKTFFPRSDLELSSSDQDDTEHGEDDEAIEEENGEEEKEEENPVEQVMESEVVHTVDKKPEKSTGYGSPDSDAFSEEGVFLNMDDLDVDSNPDKSATVSDVSDDTYVSEDSVFLSPEEGELEEERQRAPTRKMSLEEAISRAASDLSKMSMFEDNAPTQTGDVQPPETVTRGSDDTRPTLATVGRGSPLRMASGLKIKITDADLDKLQSHDQTAQSTSGRTAFSDSPVYPENEFNFSRVELRKSSSLKTNKTPPGTPHRKKVVRFADAMGLDLESVRHVLNMESPPKIPPSAMADLRTGINEDRKGIGAKYLCPCFNQPGASDTFFHRVSELKVSLENAIITDLTITGFVRVANISFHKSVRVRYTHNDWATFHDIAASYVQNSCDGPTDRFSFSIVAPAFFVPGCRLQFAVSYNAGGAEYWDNNDGKNFIFECFAKTVPTESETAWMHFI